VLVFFVTLVCSSTVLFSYVEEHALFDSLYMTIAVISTVGFRDMTPHTQARKLLIMFDALSGLTIYIYLITSWQATLVEEGLERRLCKIAQSKARDSHEKKLQEN
jgi:hypothetical protein